MIEQKKNAEFLDALGEKVTKDPSAVYRMSRSEIIHAMESFGAPRPGSPLYRRLMDALDRIDQRDEVWA